MQIARVIGRATSTVKHPTLQGWRLLLVQPLGVADAADGPPQLVLDHLGSRSGDKVLICSDGKATRELVKADNTPARWAIMGIID